MFASCSLHVPLSVPLSFPLYLPLHVPLSVRRFMFRFPTANLASRYLEVGKRNIRSVGLVGETLIFGFRYF
jgi:hypothetical protein